MSVKIFFSYAHEDEELLRKLQAYLEPLKDEHLVDEWYAHDVSVGTEWVQEINTHLNTAYIILLLVSQYWLDSDYPYSAEMQQAMERHALGNAQVIPVILRPVYYQKTPIVKLQVLPVDAKPVVNWLNLDEAFLHITDKIRIAAKELEQNNEASRRNGVQQLRESDDFYRTGRYIEALAAYETAMELIAEQDKVEVWHKKGVILRALKRYEEALVAFEKALALDSINAIAWYDTGTVLRVLNRHQEAISAFERAELLAPGATDAHYNKEITLQMLKNSRNILSSSIESSSPKPGLQENQTEILASPTVISANAKIFAEKLLDTDQIVIVNFSSDHSDACQIFEPEFTAVAREYQGRITFARINVDNNDELTKQYQVDGIPTSIFFKNQREIYRVKGIIMRAKLRRQVEKVLLDSRSQIY